MAIMVILDYSTQGTVESYERSTKIMEEAMPGNPEGGLFHFAARKGEGYIVINIWESQEAWEKFSQTLIPILNQVGTPLVRPEVYPILDSLRFSAVSNK